ncbi:hypothetical protein B0H66DRAFT_181049 [Apodospora peruviana]|uniref:YwbE n=1 Tax=Apodospora peruviana TaxID=516989 RepID=A0AAE0M8F8_9PEZI|nr:hypothetical protein B0H66DRAFT_181049 [Apodospora peruviana]
MPVPTIRDVVRGASVNIVLKVDQPTGRTVSGKVQDVLTRGNHPRGIKVRLADGRIGRVQSMAEASGASAPDLSEASIDAETGHVGSVVGAPPRDQLRRRPRPDDQDAPAPRQVVGLDAYIKPAKNKRGPGRKNLHAANTSADGGSSSLASDAIQENVETTVCPVCSNFEGDETAVAHHVATHFED